MTRERVPVETELHFRPHPGTRAAGGTGSRSGGVVRRRADETPGIVGPSLTFAWAVYDEDAPMLADREDGRWCSGADYAVALRVGL